MRSEAGRRTALSVELASRPSEIERGLMYRQSMPEDHGMYFIFPEEGPRIFWMKNTLIPLDMLFIDSNGLVVGIVEEAEPLTLTSRTVEAPARYVLEVNGGWCRRHGVKRGDGVHLTR